MAGTGTLWAIIGATGTGKSALSLDLAEHRGDAEIINADAMQFYRGMDIGTAKLPEDERRGIPHHLFDALPVTEEATVAWYQPTARALIAERLERGTDVILVGGSGLYVSSVLFDFAFPPRDENLRAELEARRHSEGLEALIGELRALAPSVANAVDLNNPRRVVRALEIALLGADAQVVLPEAPRYWYEKTRIVGIHTPRETLVPRLDARVVEMWRTGLLGEVEGLLEAGLKDGPTASRAIGYAQAIAQLEGTCSEEEAIEQTQKLTRRYARRQVSWFKRYNDIEWVDAPDLRLIEATA